jgi:hypothetical protein
MEVEGREAGYASQVFEAQLLVKTLVEIRLCAQDPLFVRRAGVGAHGRTDCIAAVEWSSTAAWALEIAQLLG